MKIVRIGAGAGYSGDRIEPALELAEHGALDYLVFECLAERTIALAQQERQRNPEAGYDLLLGDRMRAVLPICRARGVRVITNMGAANPREAARVTATIAQELGLHGLRIAAVTGIAKGSVTVDGMDMARAGEADRGRIVGPIFQQWFWNTPIPGRPRAILIAAKCQVLPGRLHQIA
jgi:hypothetical protein